MDMKNGILRKISYAEGLLKTPVQNLKILNISLYDRDTYNFLPEERYNDQS